MKILRIGVLVCVTCGLTGAAWARLGENQLQHQVRYGKAKEDEERGSGFVTIEPNTVKTYYYEGWRLVVTFRNGIAEKKVYWKNSPQPHEVEAILAAEAGGGTWTAVNRYQWANSNGRVLTRDALHVTVKTAAEIKREEAEAAERKKVKPAPKF